MISFLNALESIRSNPIAKRFEIGEMLFAMFSCPVDETSVIWTQTDFLIHVLSGISTWKVSDGMRSAEAGQTVFFKKGALILPQYSEEDQGAHSLPPHFGEAPCVQFYFIPDDFIRGTVMELAKDLPAVSEPLDERERTIHVNNDLALSAFFHAMTVYFAADEKPPEALHTIVEIVFPIWKQIANTVISQKDSDAWDAARILTLVYFALAGGAIACFQASSASLPVPANARFRAGCPIARELRLK